LENIKIFAAGGCHVSGWPFDEKSGFIARATEFLDQENFKCEYRILSPLPLSKPQSATRICEDFNPDILVLQLGNYESITNFKKFFNKKLGINLNKKNKNSIVSSVPTHDFIPDFKWHIKNNLKYIIDSLFFHKVVDLKEVENKLKIFFHTVSEQKIKNVIVLSPLPCKDLTVYKYREHINKMIKETAENFGFYFFDVLNFEKQYSHSDYIFTDPIHLNKKGHEILGRFLYNEITTIINNER
jgi:hypothetical protein